MAWLGLGVPSWAHLYAWHAGCQELGCLSSSDRLEVKKLPEFIPIYTLTSIMAKPEAAKGLVGFSLRSCTASFRNLVTTSHKATQLKRWGKRLHILMGGTSKVCGQRVACLIKVITVTIHHSFEGRQTFLKKRKALTTTEKTDNLEWIKIENFGSLKDAIKIMKMLATEWGTNCNTCSQ